MFTKVAKSTICGIIIPLLIFAWGRESVKKMENFSADVQVPSNQRNQVELGFYREYVIEDFRSKSTLLADGSVHAEGAVVSEKIDQALMQKISYGVMGHKEVLLDFKRTNPIIMGSADGYTDMKGITCFRGNHYRNAPSYGYAVVDEGRLEKVWEVATGGIDSWTGVGWNGQPAIVEWEDHIKKRMNIFDNKKEKGYLREVIYAALDGKVYFLDLEDGSATRNKITIDGPVKGSLSVDPRGIPLLYVGQGINMVNGKKVEMGYRVFSLIDHKKLLFINGRDSFAYRGWSAFDSTAIIDGKTDTMLLGGENGLLYTVKLNTQYDQAENGIEIEPEIIKYRYKIKGNAHQGIENSVAVYKNLVYFADNGGWLQCVDLNTLQPIWIQDLTDDTDSTVVIDEEETGVFLYTGCEVDKQGAKGHSFIRKIDALSGEIIWEKGYLCDSKLGEKPNNGGVLATPVVGKKSIGDLVVYNVARHGGFNKGLLVALDKATGDERWRLALSNYSWSSPVDIYTEEGEAFSILCDSAGQMYLIEALTGKVLNTISLGSNVEGSPAVFENMIVVGTRGQKIFGIRIW